MGGDDDEELDDDEEEKSKDDESKKSKILSRRTGEGGSMNIELKITMNETTLQTRMIIMK